MNSYKCAAVLVALDSIAVLHHQDCLAGMLGSVDPSSKHGHSGVSLLQAPSSIQKTSSVLEDNGDNNNNDANHNDYHNEDNNNNHDANYNDYHNEGNNNNNNASPPPAEPAPPAKAPPAEPAPPANGDGAGESEDEEEE